MKKKFLTLSIYILMIVMLFSVKVSAETATITSATITVTPSKTEYKAGDTVEFTVSLKNLNASSGIMGLGAYIEYDSNLLTLNTKAEGLSGWSDATISESSHRFATTKEEHSANNENILKITFTAKETVNNAETAVTLKKIEISNGAQYNISEVSSTKITIKPNENPPAQQDPDDGKDNKPTPTPTPKPSTTPTSKPTPTKQADNKKDNTTSSGNLPATGINNYLLIIILDLTIIAVVTFVKIKILDKKNNIQRQDFINKDDENK